MTKQTEKLLPCPFMIGDKVRVISPLLKGEWQTSECYIVGINLKGDNFDRYDFTIREVGVMGTTDGWSVHDLKCIERTPNLSSGGDDFAMDDINLVGMAMRDALRELNGKRLFNTEVIAMAEAAIKARLFGKRPNLSALDSDEAVEVVALAIYNASVDAASLGGVTYRAGAKAAIQAVKGMLK
jgi:hypothetical protein